MKTSNQPSCEPTGDPLFPGATAHYAEEQEGETRERHSPNAKSGDPLLDAIKKRDKAGFSSELHGHGDPVMDAAVEHWGNSGLSEKGCMNLHRQPHEEFKKAGDPLFHTERH
jgi:hypothetical protein